MDPSSVSIGLSVDGTGLGIPQSPMDIGAALSSIDGLATYIKGQGLMQIIMSCFGWFGTLGTLDPWAGYMLNTVSSGTLTYPSDGVLSVEEVMCLMKA